MVAVTTVLSIAGAVKGAVGAIRQGQAAKQEGDFRARELREQNIIEQQRLARELTETEREQRLRRGATIARTGGAGIQPLGSVESLLADVATDDLLELETLRFNTALGVRGREQGAQFAEVGGERARTSSFFTAGGNLASGFADVDFGEKGNPPKKLATRPRNPSAGRGNT